MQRAVGIELALPPRVLQLPTDPLDFVALQEPRQVFPNLSQGG
jgi:hypothetical protein